MAPTRPRARNEPNIQSRPPAQLPERLRLALPVAAIRPVIRIAHRVTGPLRLAERVIFDHEIVVVLRGEGSFTLRTGGIPFSPHTLLLIPPWVPHGFAAMTVCEHIAVHFDLAPAFPARALDGQPPYRVDLEPGFELPIQRRLQPEDGIEASLIALVEDWEMEAPETLLRAHARLSLLLGQLLVPRSPASAPGGSGSPGAPDGMAAALAAMRERFAEGLTLADCARIAQLSTTRFAHRFRAATGYAPMEYLRRLRVEHARRLLADRSRSIRDIAQACGFDDPYHFSRVFRSIDGLAPSHYREAALAGRSEGTQAT